jgi:hypothetical protein
MKKPMLVTKFSGELVPFDESRLYNSLKHSGASEKSIQQILLKVRNEMVDKKSTSKIYREAFSMLKQLSKATAARYNLKRAIMELGPSGFPFERYIAEIFRHQGYAVNNNLNMNGKCVSHEVDVLAMRHEQALFIECKFHNRQGLKSDVKVSMYYKARVDDLRAGNVDKEAFKDKKIGGCLVTNTRFTEDAIQYSKCENLQLLSWDYPFNASLKDKIGLTGLYPLSCLTSMSKKEKLSLLEKGHVMAKELLLQPKVLKEIGLSNHRYNVVLNEIKELCNS